MVLSIILMLINMKLLKLKVDDRHDCLRRFVNVLFCYISKMCRVILKHFEIHFKNNMKYNLNELNMHICFLTNKIFKHPL